MRALCGVISVLLQGLLFVGFVVCGHDDLCPKSVHPLEGRCKIGCLLDSHCERWQYCCKTGCWSTCVNLTKCQLQRIDATKAEGTFAPICKADGSFNEIQCLAVPVPKCWGVDKEGKKVPDSDVIVPVNAAYRQPQVSKEQSVGEYRQLDEEDEEEENMKTKCEKMRERRTKAQKTRTGAFVPRCKTNGQFKRTQCHKKTGNCWCVDREGRQIPGTRVRGKRPNCKIGQCGRRYTVYSDVRRTRRIVGGEESVPNSWPWMVALFFNGTKLRCGGSIIKPSWIVTAAHCFSESTSKKPSDWDVRIGEHSLLRDEGRERKLGVRQIIIHPDYQPGNSSHPGDNDIALVRLSSSVKLNRFVNQICLADSFSFFNPGRRCIVTGWGQTSWKGSSSPVLREAWIDLVSREACNSESSYNGTIGENFLCAGFKEGGTDACAYDSGGPLACPVMGGRWVLAGIVSWGERCAMPHKYGVYTSMHKFSSWMKRTLKKDR